MSSAGDELVVDGATGVTLEQVMANLSSALEHHDEMLRSLMTSNTAFYNQLSTLTDRVTQLANRSSPPVPLVAPAPVLNPASPAKEPHVPVPERYSGDFGSCRAFLTQVSLVFDLQPRSYASERAKVAFLVSLLSGAARDWGTSLWEQQGAVCNSYASFTAEMRKIFDHPVRGRDAADRLLSISQGSRSVADYAVDFRTLASETDWNDGALRGVFYKGLQDTLKDELALREELATLEQCIDLAIRLDNRLRERRREKQSRSSVEVSVSRSRAPESPPSAAEPEPMQLGRAKLSAEERKHRRVSHLCLYCGELGHYITVCPRRQPKDSAHQ
uniref:CCHC-type domain-containing protein n=1 Tax=Amphiprion ocellaris TaxID=80972 RepID=A0AAQ5ZXR0_AMPOC